MRSGRGVRAVHGSGNRVESYMISSLQLKFKMRAVPFGVYEMTCAEGSAKDMREYRRVKAMLAFRVGQWS